MSSEIKKAQQLYEVLELKASTKIENILKNLCVEFLEERIRMECVSEESFFWDVKSFTGN